LPVQALIECASSAVEDSVESLGGEEAKVTQFAGARDRLGFAAHARERITANHPRSRNLYIGIGL